MRRGAKATRCGVALLVGATLLACAPRPAPSRAAPVAIEIPPAPVVAEEPEAEEEDLVGVKATATSEFAGTWQGIGVQNDGDTWPMVLEAFGHDGLPCARATYPPHPGWDLSCVCLWECDQEASTPSRFVGVERVVEGFGNCIDGCSYVVDFTTGILDFDCSFADVMARVELQRVP